MSQIVPAWFVNKDSGLVCHVTGVDLGHAHMTIVMDDGRASSYAMPIAEYDANFVKLWRPATAADLSRETAPSFRLPANAPAEWREVPIREA